MEAEKRRGTAQQDFFFFYFSYIGGISLLPPFQVYSYLIITVISHILDNCKLLFFSWWNSGPARKMAGITKLAMSRERNRAWRRSTHKTSQWISCRTRSTTNNRRHVCLARSAVIGQRTYPNKRSISMSQQDTPVTSHWQNTHVFILPSNRNRGGDKMGNLNK